MRIIIDKTDLSSIEHKTSYKKPILKTDYKIFVNQKYWEENKETVIKKLNRMLKIIRLFSKSKVDSLDLPQEMLTDTTLKTLKFIKVKSLTIYSSDAEQAYLTSDLYDNLRYLEMIYVDDAESDFYQASNVYIKKKYQYKGQAVRYIPKTNTVSFGQIRYLNQLHILCPLTDACFADLDYILKNSSQKEIFFYVDFYNPKQYLYLVSVLKSRVSNKKVKIYMNARIEENYSDVYKELQSYSDENFDIFIKYSSELSNLKDSSELTKKDDTTLSEYIKTHEILTIMSEHINSKGYSPYEKAIYIYDVVKSLKYTATPEEDAFTAKDSRSLHKVLLGEYIVCIGYANFLNALLIKCGINAVLIPVKIRNGKEEVGHLRNLVRLQDEKYNIDSIFLCDATWDSKRDYSVIDLYNFFMMTIKNSVSNVNVEFLNSANILVTDEIDAKKSSSYYFYIKEVIIWFSALYPEFVSPDFDYSFRKEAETEAEFQRIKQILEKTIYYQIPLKTFVDALSFVRKNEGFYQNAEEMKKDIEKLLRLNNLRQKSSYKSESQIVIEEESVIYSTDQAASFNNIEIDLNFLDEEDENQFKR